MKKWLGLVLVIALIGIAVYNVFTDDHHITEGIKIGDKAPDFELHTLDGDTVKLSDYKGKRIMINFWATWCPPCIKETPEMVDFYDTNKQQDIEILSVNLVSTETSTAAVEKFIETYHMSFTTVIDAMDDVNKTYQVGVIPTSYFIDADGVIRQKIEGGVSGAQLKQIFKEMR